MANEYRAKRVDQQWFILRPCSKSCNGTLSFKVKFPEMKHIAWVKKRGSCHKCKNALYLKQKDLEETGLDVLRTTSNYHIISWLNMWKFLENHGEKDNEKFVYQVPISITNQEMDKEKKVEACKVVVCDVMDRVRDVLIEKFMAWMNQPKTVFKYIEKTMDREVRVQFPDNPKDFLDERRAEFIETFKETRKNYLRERCGKAFNRFTTAVVIFCLTMINLGHVDNYDDFDTMCYDLSYPRMTVIASLEARKYYDEMGRHKNFYFDSDGIRKRVKKLQWNVKPAHLGGGDWRK